MLADIFPEADHVYQVGLAQALDLIVWEYARQNDYVLVTRDSDFNDLSVLLGFPPKVIWIRRGNCSTRAIEEMLRTHKDAIEAFGQDTEAGILTLF
jgi:predicted nuclease of predicted toxin-antitoxin system